MKRLFQKPARFSVLFFLLPLSFFAYFCDFHIGTVVGYAASALLLSLPWLLDRSLPRKYLLPLHLLSLLVSVFCNAQYGQTDQWHNYCKPFTPIQQMAFQHLIYLLFGLGASHIFPRRKT